MNKIITKSLAEIEGYFTIKEAMDAKIHSELDSVRSNAAILIGLKMDENYSRYSSFLLDELGEPIHHENVRLGIKSAWTIALVLAENLKSSDYPKLKKQFATWDKEDKELMLLWLADYPEQSNILKNGKLD